MATISLEETSYSLSDLIHRLVPGEVATITENGQPVAQILPITQPHSFSLRPRPPITGIPRVGSVPGLVVPDDFKAPLEELREYME